MSLRARPIALLALLVGMLALVAAGCGDDDSGGGGSAGGGGGEKKTYKIGVSNTLVGNGWREEMICSVKAQALASARSTRCSCTTSTATPARRSPVSAT